MLLIFLMVVIKNMKIASFIQEIEMCRCFVVDNWLSVYKQTYEIQLIE